MNDYYAHFIYPLTLVSHLLVIIKLCGTSSHSFLWDKEVDSFNKASHDSRPGNLSRGECWIGGACRDDDDAGGVGCETRPHLI